MIWRKYTIHTTTEAEEIVAASLAELGIEGVEIEDRQVLSEADTKGMFIDILPELGVDDGRAALNFYLEILSEPDKAERMEKLRQLQENPGVDASYSLNSGNIYTEAEAEELLADVRGELEQLAAFCDIGEGRIEVSETEDKDWINNWKSFFHPFTVDDILIKPSWEEVPEEDRDKLMIQIDPGTAFGTGTHETTQLCIRQLRKYLRPDMQVCDLGTGSGILGITALKLGAAAVKATDLDEAAVPAVTDNLALNGLTAERFELLIGNVLGDEGVVQALGEESFDLVLANILAPVIILLCPLVPRLLKPGAVFISSGIICDKEAEVLAAFEAESELEILEVNHQGEWLNVTARRRG